MKLIKKHLKHLVNTLNKLRLKNFIDYHIEIVKELQKKKEIPDEIFSILSPEEIVNKRLKEGSLTIDLVNLAQSYLKDDLTIGIENIETGEQN